MRRHFIINFILFGLAIVLSYMLYDIWRTPIEEVHPPEKKTQGKIKSETDETKKDIVAYQVIVQKDLFRPTRTEWKEEAIKSGLPPTPPPTLYGIMITDNDRIAILEESPSSIKRKIYRVKDQIGGFVVSEIEREKVVLIRGEEKIVVSLREIKTISQPARPGATPPRSVPRPIPPQSPPIQTPSPMPSSPSPIPMDAIKGGLVKEGSPEVITPSPSGP